MLDLWEDHTLQDDDRSAFKYIVELQKLAESVKITAQKANISASRYKSYFNVKPRTQATKYLCYYPGTRANSLLPGRVRIKPSRNKVRSIIWLMVLEVPNYSMLIYSSVASVVLGSTSSSSWRKSLHEKAVHLTRKEWPGSVTSRMSTQDFQ